MNDTERMSFNSEQVKASIEGIIKAYNNLHYELNDNIQHGFIDKMADLWACGDSQQFFTAMKEDVDLIISKINLTFESIVNSMNSAATVWAEASNVNYDKVVFNLLPSTINISKILPSFPDGSVGITQNAPTEANSALDLIKTGVSNALVEAKGAVENCGFSGGMQSENLQGSLNEIEKSINNIMERLTVNLSKYIASTAEKIGYVASSSSSAFSGTEV